MRGRGFVIRRATLGDHKAIMLVARQSPYTRDFSNRIFSGAEMYVRGWIRVLELEPGKIDGFTCVRHKVRAPETVLYFIGIDKGCHRAGLGTELLRDLVLESPHKRVRLNVMKENEQARAFYRKHGFEEVGESLEGKGVQLLLIVP